MPSIRWAVNGSEKCRPAFRPVKSTVMNWLRARPQRRVQQQRQYRVEEAVSVGFGWVL